MSNSGFFQKLKKALMGGDEKPPATSVEPVSKPSDTGPVEESAAINKAPVEEKATPASGAAPVGRDNALFARQCLKLAGGHDNITRIDACVSRIRLTLKDATIVSARKLKAIGASAVVRVGDKNLQVVVGPEASDIAEAMKNIPATDDLSTVEVPA